MLGHMMAGLNRKILSLYVKLGDRMGLWSSNNQIYIDLHGKTGRRLYADWEISTEEYENGYTKNS